jgi:arylsulfatase A-like enzyme
MAVRWPGVVEAGSWCDVPVTSVDFYPTLLEVTGAAVPDGKVLDGESLTGLLTGEAALRREAIYWHSPCYLAGQCPRANLKHGLRQTPAGVIRKGDWKLIEFFEDGGNVELYNLREDIGEYHDRSKRDPERAAVMLEQLKNWPLQQNSWVSCGSGSFPRV